MDLEAGLTRAQAATFLGVTRGTVSMWAQRGWLDAATGERRRLTVVTHAGRSGRTYRLGDLLDAERDTRANPNSHRATSVLIAV